MSDAEMKHLAIVLHPGPKNLKLEAVPMPEIEQPDDAIVKVLFSGLCGSDLHAFRRLEPFSKPYVMGHEVVGEVTALGSSFDMSDTHPEAARREHNIKIGSNVVCPFSISCGECDFCHIGFTSRCVHSQLLGSQDLPGAQAQFVRVPKAIGTLRTMDDLDVPMETAILLGDILPTGFWAVRQAMEHPNIMKLNRSSKLTIAVIGLGPVGQCALISLLDGIIHKNGIISSANSFSSYRVLAIDRNEDRLTKTASVIQSLVQAASNDNQVLFVNPEGALSLLTAPNEGAHAVCEIVGHDSAIRLAYDISRPFGVISSVGVHTSPALPISGGELYTKNISLSFGRCPVRSVMEEAIIVLKRQRDILKLGSLVDQTVGFSSGTLGIAKAYKNFDEGRVGKVLFDPWN